MNKSSISVFKIPQLRDNYSYIVANETDAFIIDPAESISILNCLKKKSLNPKAILLTHHHDDHTSGVADILQKYSIATYASNSNIKGTTNIVKNGDVIDLSFISMDVISTPGHTLDHVVFYNKENNILFSGDTLFRLGCGRVFEGTYYQMYESLKKILFLADKTLVYCGHEYTNSNLKFLMSIFNEHEGLKSEAQKIKDQILRTESSIPFSLGAEKELNPFLCSKSEIYTNFKNLKKMSEIEMFSYLRDLKNSF